MNKVELEIIAAKGNWKDLKKYAKKRKVKVATVIDSILWDNKSFFKELIICNNFKLCYKILKKKLYVSSFSSNGENELTIIAYRLREKNAFKTAIELIKNNIDLNERDMKYGNTSLMYLCINLRELCLKKQYLLISQCIKHNGNFNMENNNKYCALDFLNKCGCDYIIDYIRRNNEK